MCAFEWKSLVYQKMATSLFRNSYEFGSYCKHNVNNSTKPERMFGWGQGKVHIHTNKQTNKPERMFLPVRRCLVEDMGKSSRSQAEPARSQQPGKSVCENNNNKNNNNSNNNDHNNNNNNNNNNLYSVPFFFKIICIIILGFSIVLFV